MRNLSYLFLNSSNFQKKKWKHFKSLEFITKQSIILISFLKFYLLIIYNTKKIINKKMKYMLLKFYH